MKTSPLAATAWAIVGAVAAMTAYHWEAAPTFPSAAYGQSQTQTRSQPNPLQTSVTFPSTPTTPPITLTPEEQANIRVYEVSNRSVVNIDTQTEQVDPFFLRRMPGQGSGSGSVIDKRGHILTNAHVIENAKQVEVTLADGQSYLAELIGQDAEHDIAVLKIDAPESELFPLSLTTSEGLRVGQQVYTLGNPFGLEGTLTKGIISSLNRTIDGRTGREMKSLIQTDAAMNPGNSGGPLLDSSGRMIGMNVAIATKTGQNTGVGFAIPASRVRRIVPELIKHGKIIRPDHGIVAVMDTESGVKIAKLRADGPASRAGVRAIYESKLTQQGGVIYQRNTRDFDRGDLLVAVDGQPIHSHSEFLELMDGYKPGQIVKLTVVRDGERLQLEMTLGEN